MDPVYTTCEAGKRRSVNHTRARARSPRRGEAVGVGVAWRGAARRDAAGRAVRVRVRDVT